MEEMNYEDLLDEILAMPLLQERIPEGAGASPLYITRENGAGCHGILGLVPTEDGRCRISGSFAVTDLRNDPVYRPVDAEPEEFEILEEAACERYTELYPRVFRFAFACRLSADQKQELRQFRDAWEQAVAEPARKAIERVFPDLWQWADRILSEN